jgi:hypothetical protein
VRRRLLLDGTAASALDSATRDVQEVFARQYLLVCLLVLAHGLDPATAWQESTEGLRVADSSNHRPDYDAEVDVGLNGGRATQGWWYSFEVMPGITEESDHG